MFTGIITDIGEVSKVDGLEDKTFSIRSAYNMGDITLGDSIACNGICLTVTEKRGDSFCVMASQETLRLTNASSWQGGDKINLEQALRVGDKLGGHMVSGHVDGTCVVTGNDEVGESIKLTVKCPAPLMKFLAVKGSVAINGVSLTINEVSGNEISMNLIPHTWQNTNLGEVNKGDLLNIEVDTLARYAERILSATAKTFRHLNNTA